MERDEAVFGQHKFAKLHVIIGLVFASFVLIQVVSGKSSYGLYGLLFIGAFAVLDIGILKLKMKDNSRYFITIRYVELVIISYVFLITLGNIVSNFLMLVLGLLMFEIIFLSDATDSYTRKMTLIITAAPSIVFMIMYLIIQRRSHENLIEMLCVIIAIVLFVEKMSTMVAEQVMESDRKLFEQRRLAERTTEAIEALRKQQEKVKKTNEELGLQKIKLEAAYNKINSVNTEMTIQNVILKYISTSLEIKTLMELITESILEACGVHVCAIVLEPKASYTKSITYKIRTRLSGESDKLLAKQIMSGCFEEYISSNEVFIDNSVQEGRYPFIIGREIESLLIIPFIMGGEGSGALICGHSQNDFFGDNREFFETIVAQFLIALHNADMYATMKQMAMRDSLTGIYNRGHLNALVDKYSKKSVQNNSPLSVALFDIDDFKQINDTYGHLFGDEVIKKIGEFVDVVATKYGGFAARYGGEEFVMVFPNKMISECSQYVEEVREMINGMKLFYEDHYVTTRVSVGIASYPETCNRVQELLGRADGAMYYSKKRGKDRVSIDNQEIQEFVKLNKR